MRYFAIFLKVFSLIILLSLILSCGKHLPVDEFPNPSTLGFHRMEFDVSNNGITTKEIGIGNISLKENQNLEGVYFKIYGLYQGTLYMKSDACSINLSKRFNGISTYKLSDLIPNPKKCSIKITAITDPIAKKEHNLVESGIIKLNVIPENAKPITIEYTRADSFIKSLFQTYNYIGQGSIQRQEGDLTSSEIFTVNTNLTIGGYFRVDGCGHVLTESFDKNTFDISFKELYKKDYLKMGDSCDFEISIIPNEVIETYMGRFSVNIYGKDAVKLEPLSWEVKKVMGKKRLYVWGVSHVLACSINENVNTSFKHDVEYNLDTIYWIRSITTNARKNIFAIKNGSLIWKE